MAAYLNSDPIAWRLRADSSQSHEQDRNVDEHAQFVGGDPTYRVRIIEDLNKIPATEWDAVSGVALVRSHAYLSAVAAADIGCKFFYILVYARDTLLAHACVYTIVTDFAQLLPSPLASMVSVLRKFWPSLLQAKLVECAAPLVAGHAVSIRVDADRARLLDVLESTITDIARRERSPLTVIHAVTGGERAEFDRLIERGYNVVRNLPLACLQVRWKTYAEYLASMRARYRTDVARRLKRAQADGQTVERLTSFAEHASLLADQARFVQTSARGFKRETLPPEYYIAMDHGFGDNSMLLVVRRAGRIVAHGMVLMDGETLVATYFGRNAGSPRGEWFQLINEVIRLGIERGVKTINLGRGSYDAKALVGAGIEPLYVYARSTFAPVNWLMRLIPGIVDQQLETDRRIFRDQI